MWLPRQTMSWPFMIVVVVKPKVFPTLSAFEMIVIVDPIGAGFKKVVLISGGEGTNNVKRRI